MIKKVLSFEMKLKQGFIACALIIIIVAVIPLFFQLPFRDNIYLTWEGAFRMYNGQMPFVDFGMPMGYAFWLLPTLSFHVFGPHLFSLVKIQVLINILSGCSFIYIVKFFTKDTGVVIASTFLYVISFSFYNFWPWYNHTVIVFEFIAIGFLLYALLKKGITKKVKIVYSLLASLFCFLSFFTKQDGGAFALMLCGLILLCHLVLSREWIQILGFSLGYLVIAFLFIYPLLDNEFGYWFNIGQSPHYSRVNLNDFFTAILEGSFFIKFYFLMIALVVIQKSKEGFEWVKDENFSIHLILTLGILFQASILQVTSYVPIDGNIYYHSFMCFFVLTHISHDIKLSKIGNLICLLLLISIWWSGLYWRYANRLISSVSKKEKNEKNVVSSSTFALKKDSTLLNKATWRQSEYKEFESIKLPQEVIKAMGEISQWYINQRELPKVLNMSELTPLASILGYELEKGMPLWYHLNVAMFDRELTMFGDRIENDYYDLVIFETIPQLNNFYPFELHEKLNSNYELWFAFQAPREKTTETISVYLKKENEK